MYRIFRKLGNGELLHIALRNSLEDNGELGSQDAGALMPQNEARKSS
jgi:hypothetical protein